MPISIAPIAKVLTTLRTAAAGAESLFSLLLRLRPRRQRAVPCLGEAVLVVFPQSLAVHAKPNKTSKITPQ